MGYDLIAMLVAGFGAGGLLMLVVKLSRGRLPKWLVPAGAGAAMIAYSIWSEYAWYPHMRSQLPETVRIASAPSNAVFYRPWTYVFPLTTRFAAVDLGRAVRSETTTGLFVAPVVLIGRWSATQELPVAFDCTGGRRADLFLKGSMGADGTIEGAEWTTPEPGDTLLAAACGG